MIIEDEASTLRSINNKSTTIAHAKDSNQNRFVGCHKYVLHCALYSTNNVPNCMHVYFCALVYAIKLIARRSPTQCRSHSIVLINTTKYMFSFKFEGRSMGDLLTTKVFLPWFTVNRETHVRTQIRRQIVGEFKYLTCTTSLAASLVLASHSQEQCEHD